MDRRLSEINIKKDESGVIKISKLEQDRICVAFSYNPDFVQKVKTIEGHQWHPEGRYRSFPNTNGTVEKIIKVFEGEKINIDPDLQAYAPIHVIARSEATKQSQNILEGLYLF